MLVDSHCHLDYLDDPEQALERARCAGVGALLCIGVEHATIGRVLALAGRHADVWASVGQHPESAAMLPQWIEALLDEPGVVAVGETGLDFLRCADDDGVQRAQLECFDYQLALAKRLNLPVVVHARAAENHTRQMLAKHAGCRGVLHCFTESWTLAKAALDLGYYISISGIATFNKADNVRAVAAKIPRDRLLIETDAPWLAPVPHRGKQNEPAFVADTARFLAGWLGWDLADLQAQTAVNFFELFDRAESPGPKASDGRNR